MMKNIISLIGLLLILTGCGHSVNSYSKGLGAEITWNPDSFSPTGRFGFYETVFTMNKENTQVKYNSNIGMDMGILGGFKSILSLFKDGNNDAVNSGTGAMLEIKTGPITTGYVREVLTNPDVKPEHVEIAKQIYSVKTEPIDNSKETYVTKDGVSSGITPKVVTKKTLTGTEVSTPTNEYTEDAIKKQVNPDGWADVIKKILIWGMFFVVIGLLGYVIIKQYKK